MAELTANEKQRLEGIQARSRQWQNSKISPQIENSLLHHDIAFLLQVLTQRQGKLYRHKKGTLYRLLAIAKHSETLEELAIYQDVEDPSKNWARPKEMFFDGRFIEEGGNA